MTVKAILLLLTLALASCATAGDGTSRKLVGRWRAAIGERSAEYVFRPDGTFRGHVTAHRAMLANFTGEWALRGNVLQYHYLGDTMGLIAPGTRDQDTLVEVAADRYVIEAADGSRREYRRVND